MKYAVSVKGKQYVSNDNAPAAHQQNDDADTDVAVITDPKVLAAFAEMAALIPAHDGNGAEDILRKILAAKSWTELDDPWDTAALDDVLDKPHMLVSATRLPSRYKRGLGMFVVLHLLDPKTGEERIKTTSAISIVGQVACAYARNWLPLKVIWRRAEEDTQAGFRPQHLEIIDGPTEARPGATKRTATQV